MGFNNTEVIYGRSVGIVRSRTKDHGVCFVFEVIYGTWEISHILEMSAEVLRLSQSRGKVCLCLTN
jgi:hypothetical protein